jgi:hypothetical protein
MRVYYQDEHFLLLHGDALDYFLIPGRFDAIATDPPFENLEVLIPTILAACPRVTLTPAFTHRGYYPVPDRQGTLFYKMQGIHVHRAIYQYGPVIPQPDKRTLTLFTEVEPEAVPPFPWDQVFPLPLARHMIRLAARPGETIVDPFLGSGTMAIAAREYGCRLIATELDEEFCELAVRRYQEHFPDPIVERHPDLAIVAGLAIQPKVV